MCSSYWMPVERTDSCYFSVCLHLTAFDVQSLSSRCCR